MKPQSLEQRLANIEQTLDKLQNNHLWHIERDMRWIKRGSVVVALLVAAQLAVVYASVL